MPFTTFEMMVEDLIRKLENEKRWTDSEQPTESVLQHMWKMAMLVQLMLAVEDLVNNPHNLNYFRLLQCAINHDIAEAEMGDVTLPNKTESSEKAEMLMFGKIRDKLFGPYNFFMSLPIDHNETMNTVHQEFWFCVEHLGYALYADERLHEGHTAFFSIFERSLRELNPYIHKFISVRVAITCLERRF